jgi:hypothetical protein
VASGFSRTARVRLPAPCNGPTINAIQLDPGNVGGRIIVKETF